MKCIKMLESKHSLINTLEKYRHVHMHTIKYYKYHDSSCNTVFHVVPHFLQLRPSPAVVAPPSVTAPTAVAPVAPVPVPEAAPKAEATAADDLGMKMFVWRWVHNISMMEISYMTLFHNDIN